MISKLLTHKSQIITQRYAHLQGDPVQEASNKIGNQLKAALDGKDKAEILSLVQ